MSRKKLIYLCLFSVPSNSAYDVYNNGYARSSYNAPNVNPWSDRSDLVSNAGKKAKVLKLFYSKLNFHYEIVDNFFLFLSQNKNYQRLKV